MLVAGALVAGLKSFIFRMFRDVNIFFLADATLGLCLADNMYEWDEDSLRLFKRVFLPPLFGPFRNSAGGSFFYLLTAQKASFIC